MNSQCSIRGTASSAGHTLRLDLGLTFAGSFQGEKKIYMIAIDNSGALSAWVEAGTWTVP